MPQTETALEYAAHGIPVFPYRKDWNPKKSKYEKKPLFIPGILEHGPKSATTDPGIILPMFEDPAAQLIGTYPGPCSGLYTLDYDTYKSIIAVEALEDHRERLPPTLWTRTGSGGTHIHFYYTGPLQLRSQDPFCGIPGCEFIAGTDGKGVILPDWEGYTPLTADGELVETVEEALQLVAPLPDWIINEVKHIDRPAVYTARPGDYWPIEQLEAFCSMVSPRIMHGDIFLHFIFGLLHTFGKSPEVVATIAAWLARDPDYNNAKDRRSTLRRILSGNETGPRRSITIGTIKHYLRGAGSDVFIDTEKRIIRRTGPAALSGERTPAPVKGVRS